MYEATLFNFGKSIDYGKSHCKGERFPLKGAWSGSRDPFTNLNPLQYFWNVHERDRQTPHDGIGCACIASRGKNKRAEDRWRSFDAL